VGALPEVSASIQDIKGRAGTAEKARDGAPKAG